ncbi:MAG: site-specific DNA-methyltransferase [Rhodobacteraceae bacterium]|nr:site-specific DNA-methyltransferase [Paracoccaceae bacterium]
MNEFENFSFEQLLGNTTQSYFQSDIVKGDVIKVLKDHPFDIKFNVIIADPPYNIGKDFGNNNDYLPMQEYIEWTKDWLYQCFRLLEDDGIIYVYGFSEILSRLSSEYPTEQQRWLVWHYTNKAVPSIKFWQRSHESILSLWKGDKRPDLEIDQIREPYTKSYLNNSAGKVRKATPSRFGGERGKETEYKAHKKGALPRDVIKIPALAGGAGATERWFMCMDCDKKVFPPSEMKYHRKHETLKHPTQKPMKLTVKLIRSRIAQKDTGRVLIPFAGSGSECVVANQLGCGYKGIEINPLYIEFAKKWMERYAIQINS